MFPYLLTYALRGSYKFGSVLTYVRPFFVTAFFSGWAHYFFLIFCMRLWDSKYSKLMEPIFWESSHLPENGPKWPSLSICPFLQHFFQDWLISFCMKLTDHKHSKLTKTILLGKFWLARN